MRVNPIGLQENNLIISPYFDLIKKAFKLEFKFDLFLYFYIKPKKVSYTWCTERGGVAVPSSGMVMKKTAKKTCNEDIVDCTISMDCKLPYKIGLMSRKDFIFRLPEDGPQSDRGIPT